jgi:hypothetical protein
MDIRARTRFGVAALLLLSACRNRVEEPKGKPASALAPAASAEKKLLLELPPGRAGEWVDARHFRVRVLDAFPCDEDSMGRPSAALDAAGEPDPRPPSATTPPRPGHYRLGVAIEVEANDAVFATPKAVEIEKNGKVFFAVMDARPSPTCRALLTPRSLHSAERASGIVVFEAPDPEYLTGGTLRFRPPRWGYESKAGIVLPTCFGKDCPEAKPTAEAKL